MSTETFPEDDCDCCGGTVPTSCCPDDPPAATLCVALEDISGGGLECYDGMTFQIQWNVGESWVNGPDDTTSGDCTVTGLNFLFDCIEDPENPGTFGWQVDGELIFVADSPYNTVPSFRAFGTTYTYTCDPFEVVIDADVITNLGVDTGLDIRVTITEC